MARVTRATFTLKYWEGEEEGEGEEEEEEGEDKDEDEDEEDAMRRGQRRLAAVEPSTPQCSWPAGRGAVHRVVA